MRNVVILLIDQHSMLEDARCLKCLSHLKLDSNNNYVCSSCGFKIQEEKYIKLKEYSLDVTFWGYFTRDSYEEEIRNGCFGEVYYSFPPIHDILIYFALAITSGIIGGASYDLIKTVVLKLKNTYQKKSEEELPLYIQSDQELEEFIKYIISFNEGLKNVDSRVRQRIIIEYLENHQEYSSNLIEKYHIESDPDEESSRKIIQETKPDNIDWEHIWEHLSKSG